MLIGAEFAMICMGLYFLFTGKVGSRGGAAITGWKARIIGLMLILPIPLGVVGGILCGIVWVLTGHRPDDRGWYWYAVGIEASTVALCLIVAALLRRKFQKQLLVETAGEEPADSLGSDPEHDHE
jgi:hypothetical protein